jgi:hypothetical protein
MRRYGQGGEGHVHSLRFGCLRGNARGLKVEDDVVKELAEDGGSRAGGVGVDLNIRVLGSGWVESGFRCKGNSRFLEGFCMMGLDQ